MSIYIYKIFDINTSSYFSDAYFNTEDVARAFYSAIKQHPNVEIHKLFLTQIIDLEATEQEETEEDLYSKAWNIYRENYVERDNATIEFTCTYEAPQDDIYTRAYTLASTIAALNFEEEITLSMQKLKKLYPHIF